MDSNEWVYGFHAVGALIANRPQEIRTLWIQQGRMDQRISNIIAQARAAHVNLRYVAKQVLDSRVKGVHQGVAAQCEFTLIRDSGYLETLLDELKEPAFLLILESLTDPHNVGACLRSAEAAGVHAVIFPRHRSIGINATVAKVASGAVERVPIIEVSNLARTLDWLKSRGIFIVGTDLENAQCSLYEVDLKGSIAMVMGSEGSGLRQLTARSCDYLIAIPMFGQTESLNVSVATGICLYEVVRQRRFQPSS